MPPPRRAGLWSKLLLLFLIIPIVELVLLIWLGGQIGFWATVGLIVATALAGSWLAQREGLSVWRRFTRRVASGQLPGRELTDGLIILVSGALLLTPGVLTDVVGLLGLLPPSRAVIRSFLSRRMQAGIGAGTLQIFSVGRAPSSSPDPPPTPRPGADEPIDVEFEEIEQPRRPRR